MKQASPTLYSANREFWSDTVRPQPGRTLIVGSHVYPGREDRRAAFPYSVGVDMLDGPGVDRVLNLEEAAPDNLGVFAHIECRSVLEHSRRPWLLAANLVALLEVGGTLDLSVPFVWKYHGYAHDYFRFTAEGIRSLFPGIDWKSLMYAGEKLKESYRTGQCMSNGHHYIERTEVLGFGVKT